MANASGSSTNDELGKRCAGLPGEGHGMQRVARRKAVAIQWCAGQRDSRVANERALAHEGALEDLVQRETHRTGGQHDGSDAQAFGAI